MRSESDIEVTRSLNVIGATNLSTIDYPGKPAMVLYFSGCPLKCPYCHNSELCETYNDGVPWEITYEMLAKQAGRKHAVVLSGGEPTTLGKDILCSVIRQLHDLKYSVKLDTSGVINLASWFSTAPELMDCAPDYMALDFKAPLGKLNKFTVSKAAAEAFRTSFVCTIAWLAKSGIGYELRTTVHKSLLSERDLQEMKESVIANFAVKHWVLQQFRKDNCRDQSLAEAPTYTDQELTVLAEKLGAYVRGTSKTT